MDTFDEEQASVSVPIVGMIVGEAATLAFRKRMILRAYHTRAKTGMQLTGNFTATVKGFNQLYSQTCRTWADVLAVTTDMLKEGNR